MDLQAKLNEIKFRLKNLAHTEPMAHERMYKEYLDLSRQLEESKGSPELLNEALPSTIHTSTIGKVKHVVSKNPNGTNKLLGKTKSSKTASNIVNVVRSETHRTDKGTSSSDVEKEHERLQASKDADRSHRNYLETQRHTSKDYRAAKADSLAKRKSQLLDKLRKRKTGVNEETDLQEKVDSHRKIKGLRSGNTEARKTRLSKRYMNRLKDRAKKYDDSESDGVDKYYRENNYDTVRQMELSKGDPRLKTRIKRMELRDQLRKAKAKIAKYRSPGPYKLPESLDARKLKVVKRIHSDGFSNEPLHRQNKARLLLKKINQKKRERSLKEARDKAQDYKANGKRYSKLIVYTATHDLSPKKLLQTRRVGKKLNDQLKAALKETHYGRKNVKISDKIEALQNKKVGRYSKKTGKFFTDDARKYIRHGKLKNQLADLIQKRDGQRLASMDKEQRQEYLQKLLGKNSFNEMNYGRKCCSADKTKHYDDKLERKYDRVEKTRDARKYKNWARTLPKYIKAKKEISNAK